MSEPKLSEQKSYAFPNELPLASIIISNYNYEKFIGRAIDSALQQTYPLKEIIVVDDGSTDNSRQIINQYGNQITTIFQENQGIVPATNTGFFASRGEIIFFLDSDDCFFPQKVEEMVKYYLRVMPQTPQAMIFHRLAMTNDEGIVFYLMPPNGLRTLDRKKENGPFAKLSDPDAAYRHIQKWGFLPFNTSYTSYTSGLSLSRSLANCIFPLPNERVLPQDRLLFYGAMLFGTVYGTTKVLGSYSIHGDNASLQKGKELGNQKARVHLTINFVNDILQKINKDRIASFYDTRYARSYYKNYGLTKELLKLTYKVPTRCLSLGTMWFSIKLLWYCFQLVVGIKKRPRLSMNEKILEKAKAVHSKQDCHH